MNIVNQRDLAFSLYLISSDIKRRRKNKIEHLRCKDFLY